MTRLGNSEFLKEITKVLSKNNGKNSIYLTQKRLSSALPLEPVSNSKPTDLPSNVIETKGEDDIPVNTSTYPVLIRISLNSKDNRKDKKDKIKFSTVIESNNLDVFWYNYIQIIKAGFIGLKKREKKKSKKSHKVSK
ncbi:uncharacterized protein J8A68_000401 [[Candida] subhashii]|uniref:Signal recognition particle subunit SRP14 n=1 Tax=[Candida] subhashii TaxID=561895 RepID=A0A8J5UUL3_9ASCO|nr:uncharacterized protein J8A68_000401 [[Candida] subhashii]KAG7665972.1 hypothetical protein J8A68_000401 [[Candida] subhashii]